MRGLVLGSSGPVTFTSGWSSSSGLLRLLGDWFWMMSRRAMSRQVWVSWVAKLEAQVQFCKSILDC